MSKQRSVWGYFALSTVCLVVGLLVLTVGARSSIPKQAALKKISGEIKSVRVIDDLSGKSTVMMTSMNAIHFILDNDATVFRFPSRWPGYSDLYNRLAFEVDVWVDPTALTSGDPVTIYRLEQRTPEGWLSPPIKVSYESIFDAKDASQESYSNLGYGLLTVAPFVFLMGVWVVRNNRRNRGAPKAD